jgi:hypothetical protein
MAIALPSAQSMISSALRRRVGLIVVVALRCVFFLIFVAAISRMMDIGTSRQVIGAAAVAGVLAGTAFAASRLRQLGFFLLLGAGFAVTRGFTSLVGLLTPHGGDRVFHPFTLLLHFDLVFFVFALACASTWLLWRVRATVTAEVLVLSASVIYLLSGHRNFHFDVPKLISTLAWDARVEHLTMIVMLGSALVVLMLLYLFLATLPLLRAAPLARSAGAATLDRGSPRPVYMAVLLGVAAVILYFTAHGLFEHYNRAALSRTANGVGQASSPGVSPLGFHSALGSSNQPAALVRLEGDYRENPFSPMLYLRESALSEFDGQQMVNAGPPWDDDVSGSSPFDAYAGKENTELESREPIVQSVYLLADHNVAFGLDYPVTISRLKNPNPGRFKAAYRVYSMGPAFSLQDLTALPVGNPSWDKKTWEHYLKTHPDGRYDTLAQKIAVGVTKPVEKVFEVMAYLSKTSIYTLTPNHDEKPGEDPVAPFLFGDHRGYCVHFAHAAVYMLRALGIPSRIGTGYLTDLSQAKDGHILLRMSDRHAWAEVYIQGRGWIPFDVQPEQVENHADTQVDMGLLEELMGMLEPGQEILPDSATKDEPGLKEHQPYYHVEAKHVAFAAALMVLLALMVKAYFRFGYLLPGSARFTLRRSCVALASTLHDLGYRRTAGETHEEFRERMRGEIGAEVLGIAALWNRAAYGENGAGGAAADEVARARSEGAQNLRSVPRWKRAVSFLNPTSLMSSFLGGRW